MRQAVSIFAATFLSAGAASAANDVMVMFDASNSMWGQIDGAAKIEIARQSMESLMGKPVGARGKGHDPSMSGASAFFPLPFDPAAERLGSTRLR